MLFVKASQFGIGMVIKHGGLIHQTLGNQEFISDKMYSEIKSKIDFGTRFSHV